MLAAMRLRRDAVRRWAAVRGRWCAAAGIARATSRLAARLCDLLLPPACAACGGGLEAASAAGRRAAARGVVCATCRAALPPAPPPERLGGLEVRAALEHRGAARALVHACKYRGRRDAAWLLAERIGASYRRHGTPACDCVVPVPLHPRRQRRRGYNQAALLAAALAERLGLPLHLPLVRRRATRTQTRLGRAARRRNVAGAFAARADTDPAVAACRGRRVLLVDDVVTTGATLEEAAAVLRRAGARAVVAQVAARAQLGGEPVRLRAAPGTP